MKIYTRTGDSGQTALFDGSRVSKADPRVDAYGHIDELNAVLGQVRASGVDSALDAWLERLQRDLFALGAQLADPASRIAPAAAALHLARTVCRRAERHIVSLGPEAVDADLLAYVNRLSDLLFVLARLANAHAGVPDREW